MDRCKRVSNRHPSYFYFALVMNLIPERVSFSFVLPFLIPSFLHTHALTHSFPFAEEDRDVIIILAAVALGVLVIALFLLLISCCFFWKMWVQFQLLNARNGPKLILQNLAFDWLSGYRRTVRLRARTRISSTFSINLLASHHECPCLIGYATRSLFYHRWWVA